MDAVIEQLARMSAQFEQLEAWHNELLDTRKQLISTAAMEQQTLSIAGRLNEKWRENTDALVRMREAVENMTGGILAMRSAFDLLYSRLVDATDCPARAERRTHGDRRRGTDGAE